MAEFRLAIQIGATGVRDLLEIVSDDSKDFEPEYVNRDGVRYERYGSDEDFIEIRRAAILSRSFHEVVEEEKPVEVKIPGLEELQHQESGADE